MMQRLRIYIGIFLSLAVMLTAHSAAAMRGAQDAATGQMVICTGTGPVVIYVDDEGLPTAPPHFCPDCVMHLLDAAASGTAEVLQPANIIMLLDLPAVADPVLSSSLRCGFARGPPSSV